MANEIQEKEIILASGRAIKVITLSNGQLTIVVHNFGARLHQLYAPDKNGTFENILLSKDNSDSYENDNGYYGVICGPVAGRIANASFGEVTLVANEGRNTLHSGPNGWEYQIWDYNTSVNEKGPAITLRLKDTFSEFPGEIEVEVTYQLSGSTLIVEMAGQSNQDTVFNPAFHPYFNLTADHSDTLNHVLYTTADQLVETNKENIPTGRLINVDDTIYNLKESVIIKDIISEIPQGFDDCFVFPNDESKKSLTLLDPKSGRKLKCETDRQAVVIYTATNPEKSLVNGKMMSPNRGIAIEFQELPDLVHHSEWGSIELKKGIKKKYRSKYHFSLFDKL
ncbi:galactose mutarotase [Lactococcus hircilactis]|uniref:Galactose mutarotase n=1 Tax=Lactococcus hircilactis TaxID=1494462 RepID=A0A7X1Z6M0_9LACT|nr:aldose epimerase family protein [Lactococcus hircilactis]MQW38593.1 galactose mutarotase [Lactococcus hircilactis]